jgi:drug/metabolite transporter (DMT)-like permease
MSWVHLLLLLAVVFWGWSFVAMKICLESMGVMELMGLRMLIGIPVLAAIILAKRVKFHYSRGDWTVVLIAGVILTAHFGIQIGGLTYTTATNTGWIISIAPASIAVLSFFILRERLRRIQVAGIFVATAGIMLLVSKGEFGNLDWLSSTGDWLALASTFTWAAYTILTRNISRRHSPLGVTFVILVIATVVAWSYLAFTTDFNHLLHLPAKAWLALIFLGVFCQALAFWFWQEGLARLGAARSGFFIYLIPLATTALAVPYLGEHLGLIALMGGLLVLGGVYLTERAG